MGEAGVGAHVSPIRGAGAPGYESLLISMLPWPWRLLSIRPGYVQGVRCLLGVLMDSHLVPRWGVQAKVIEVIAGRWP